MEKLSQEEISRLMSHLKSGKQIQFTTTAGEHPPLDIIKWTFSYNTWHGRYNWSYSQEDNADAWRSVDWDTEAQFADYLAKELWGFDQTLRKAIAESC
jgi:hypothetical protein